MTKKQKSQLGTDWRFAFKKLAAETIKKPFCQSAYGFKLDVDDLYQVMMVKFLQTLDLGVKTPANTEFGSSKWWNYWRRATKNTAIDMMKLESKHHKHRSTDGFLVLGGIAEDSTEENFIPEIIDPRWDYPLKRIDLESDIKEIKRRLFPDEVILFNKMLANSDGVRGDFKRVVTQLGWNYSHALGLLKNIKQATKTVLQERGK